MSTTGAVEVRDEPESTRYEITVDGGEAGIAAYMLRPGLIVFVHTEIDERFEGQGLASRLITFALDDARRRGLAVVPLCPFVTEYLQHHPEYVDLVPAQQRARFGL
jgi:predicted GNAT family acetyltransferase